MKVLGQIKTLFTKSEAIRLVFIFFGTLIMGVLEVIGVASIAPFIAVVTSPEIINENKYLAFAFQFSGADNNQQFIVFLGINVISLMVLSNFTQAFISWKIVSFSEMLNTRLSTKLLQKYLMRPYSFFLNKNTSDLGKNILSEVGRVTNGVIMQFMFLTSKLIISTFMLLFLVVINPKVAITIIFILGGAYLLIFTLVKERVYKIGLKATDATFASFKAANEAMSGIKDIKLKGAEEEFVNRFFEPTSLLASVRIQLNLVSSLPRYLLEIVAFGGIILLIIFVILTTQNSNNLIALISIYALAGYRLMPALQQIYSAMTSIKYNSHSLENLSIDFTNPIPARIEFESTDSIRFNKKLKVNQISFSYEGSENLVLNKIELSIYPNTKVGIVGETGSGKSTLVDIMLGLIEPDSGFISIDGVAINEQNISVWQKYIGYVPQSIYLTDDTIAANIAFGCPNNDINLKKVKRAAELANLDKFINTLPEKYKTSVGERGVRLSGGQKQRVVIARALYNDPQVIFMDEATSSLDGITESAIMEAIHNLSKEKTIIMIAHRLSSIREFDVIHYVKNGQVIDSGSFDDLMTKNKEFQRLANNL
jgi:ATP-binding cassette, subfamily B, bacterial PglK